MSCAALEGVKACYLAMWYEDAHYDSDWGRWYGEVG